MAETIRGLGFVWGVNGLTFTGFNATEPTFKTQSLDLTRDSDVAQLENESGEVVGECFFNSKKVMNVSVIPSATSVATAQGNLDKLIPAPGTIITVADANGTTIDATNSGKFTCLSAKMGRTNKGMATVDLQLRQYEANDVTTTVS
jgi:hypothetical protein